MSYFAPIEHVLYRFGGLDNSLAAFQNLSAYADVMDKFKETQQSYLNYEIKDGDRPDILSARMYGDPKYYFTFYIMNDHLRRQGWPLSYNDMVKSVKEKYPNTTLVFRTFDDGNAHIGHPINRHNLINIFKIGSVLEGVLSGTKGTVVKKDLDKGHVIVTVDPDPNKTWENGESVKFDRITANPLAAFDPNPIVPYADVTIFENARLKSSSLEINSAHHYEDANGNWVDIDPRSETQSSFIVEKTYLDTLQAENDKLRTIKYLKPTVIRAAYKAFVETMSG